MLSEEIYRKMKLDREFNTSLSKANMVEAEYSQKFVQGIRPDLGDLNRAYHALHKSAFELSMLFSPRATVTPPRQGDFLLTIMTIAGIGQAYIGNVISLIERNGIRNPSVKRVDKLLSNFRQMQEIFTGLEADVRQSLDAYISRGEHPSRDRISRYSKDLLRLRRAYFRVRAKLNALEKSVDFSGYEYRHYEPLVMLMRSQHQTHARKQAAPATTGEYKEYVRSLLQESNSYMNAVFDFDARRARHKRKDLLDIENAKFIASYKLPRDAVVRHAEFLKSMNPTVFFTEDEFHRIRPEGRKTKPDALLFSKK
ncbi:MAG: hypothetical protein N3H30_02845 [Candidatus Micrarchaeota archaeon]|nr:hypothetical protein [Candidatus Micrarchaeota archaeon]